MSLGTKILHNQFSVQSVVVTPCPPSFYALLNIWIKIKRPYDTGDGVANINEYGEVVMKTGVTSETIISTVKARINDKKGEGLVVDYHGKSVLADCKLFTCPSVDIQENDLVVMGNKEYLVIKVESFTAYSKIHHLEIWIKNYKTV